jgi:hypothetical protein
VTLYLATRFVEEGDRSAVLSWAALLRHRARDHH